MEGIEMYNEDELNVIDLNEIFTKKERDLRYAISCFTRGSKEFTTDHIDKMKSWIGRKDKLNLSEIKLYKHALEKIWSEITDQTLDFDFLTSRKEAEEMELKLTLMISNQDIKTHKNLIVLDKRINFKFLAYLILLKLNIKTKYLIINNDLGVSTMKIEW